MTDGSGRRAWLDALRQVAKGVKGAAAALEDVIDDDAVMPSSRSFSPRDAVRRQAGAVASRLNWASDVGPRAVLAELLTTAAAAARRDDALRRDAKVSRAFCKAARAVLLIRGSAAAGKARGALNAVRARRRHGGSDAAAFYEQRLKGGADEARRLACRRGAHDSAERALCLHWAWSADAALRSARRLRRDGGGAPARATDAHDALVRCVAELTAHDYADVRGCAAETTEACWAQYGWALRPRLPAALAELRGERHALFPASLCSKRSSELFVF